MAISTIKVALSNKVERHVLHIMKDTIFDDIPLILEMSNVDTLPQEILQLKQ
jgi:hypothetical protein